MTFGADGTFSVQSTYTTGGSPGPGPCTGTGAPR
jgi:hypothetical protein